VNGSIIKKTFKCSSLYSKAKNTGARPKYPHLEEKLIEWVKETQNQLKTVIHYMI